MLYLPIVQNKLGAGSYTIGYEEQKTANDKAILHLDSKCDYTDR